MLNLDNFLNLNFIFKGIFYAKLLWGGEKQDKPCDAKFSEKCPFRGWGPGGIVNVQRIVGQSRLKTENKKNV